MLICDLLSKENISKYNCGGLIVNSCEFSVFNDKTFTVNEFNELVNLIHETNKKAILSIDRIVEEFELEDFYQYLDKVFKIPFDLYVYSDLSVLNYVVEHKLNVNLIYDSKTMVTNLKVASLYQDLFDKFGLNGLVYPMISNELSINDLKNIFTYPSAFEVYGYHQIFYSRRLIFSSYTNYKKLTRLEDIKENLEDKLLHLKEEFREELYPIYQSKYGTFIYNSKKFCAFKELSEFGNVKIYKINGSFIPEDELIQVVSIYNRLLTNGYSSDLEKELLSLDENVTKGFLYKESFLLKEGQK